MLIFPGAKINIGLRITRKRPDGYHDLQTIFYPVRLADALEYIVAGKGTDTDSLTVTGISTACNPEDNIVIKTLKKIREVHPVPNLKIHLHKAIPAGAGLGGGSSDAACLIKSLNRYFNIGLDKAQMKELAASLGSDCPFFIDNVPSYGEGRGEILTPIDTLPGHYHLLIVKPRVEVSTAEAYSACTPKYDGRDLISFYTDNVGTWKDLISNDFEDSIFLKYPEIGSLKESIYKMGALYSSMSGSGSAVYGIFDRQPKVPDYLADKIIYSGIL